MSIDIAQIIAQRRLLQQRQLRGQRKLRPVHPASANEVMYRRDLLALVRDMEKTVREEVTPVAKTEAERRNAQDSMVFDAKKPPRAPAKVEKAISDASRKYKDIAPLAQREAEKVARENLQTVDKRLTSSIKSRVGIDLNSMFTNTPGLKRQLDKAIKDNVELITSIPDEYFAKLRKAMRQGFASGMRPETIAKEIRRVGHVTESRAHLIARDQTSKMNSAFNMERQKSVGITEYIWQTSGDERVRDTHAENDGKRFSWSSPPAETGHPGEDINCRCVAIPVIEL